MAIDSTNITAQDQYWYAFNNMTTSTMKTLFDSFGVTISKSKSDNKSETDDAALLTKTVQYYDIFDLVMTYTFISVCLFLFH